MAPDVAMEQRWGFLSAWCTVLQYRIHYRLLQDEADDMWRPRRRALQVILPTRAGIYGEYKDEETFQIEFQNTREALALLAAVAHVDYHAWKYLLANHCGVDFRNNSEISEQEIHVKFAVLMEHQAETDLIQLCGITQRRMMSPGYFNCLQRIAAMDGNLERDHPGFDIEIPVRVIFSSSTVFSASNGPIQILGSIQMAEKLIRDEWESYNWSLENQPVEPGQLRCTFLLEPMIADIKGLGCSSEIAEMMAKFVGENVWFSQVSMRAEMDQQKEEKTTSMSFRQMMAVVFDATRRSQELANTRYCTQLVTYNANNPLQMGSVLMQCDSTLGLSEFESIFSAVVLTQTTRKFTIRLQLNSRNAKDRRDWWKWLAYGCFSERARTCSALESLVLTDIDNISTGDMRDFSAVRSSERPEEVLYGSPHGAVAGRYMMLKKGAPVQWLLTKDGLPRKGSHPVMFSAAIPYVRMFSDDGSSEVVNVLIPGFGRCLVKREELVDPQELQYNGNTGGLKSLTLKFADCTKTKSKGGLVRLLAATGSSLIFLTIDGPGEGFDESVILKNCPNLLELSLRKGRVGVQLNFSEFHTRKKHIPKLRFRWQDISALSSDLSNMHNPFTKCARRLSIRLTYAAGVGNSNWARCDEDINSNLDALLKMLEVNQTLEYLEVTVPSGYHNYRDYFRIHHFRALNRGHKLSTEIKVAFLSILPTKVKSVSFKPGTTVKSGSQSSRSIQCGLDRRLISSIFQFATTPVFRQVYFREKLDDGTVSEIC